MNPGPPALEASTLPLGFREGGIKMIKLVEKIILDLPFIWYIDIYGQTWTNTESSQ